MLQQINLVHFFLLLIFLCQTGRLIVYKGHCYYHYQRTCCFMRRGSRGKSRSPDIPSSLKTFKIIKISVKLRKIGIGSGNISGSAQGLKSLMDLINTHKSSTIHIRKTTEIVRKQMV